MAEKRLIDANKALERADEVTFMGFHAEERKQHFMDLVSEILKQSTVDAVEVVRCKDCDHGVIDACTHRLMCARCGEVRPNGHVWGGTSTLPENFCSYGRRRPNG